jgi:hypothetical protein
MDTPDYLRATTFSTYYRPTTRVRIDIPADPHAGEGGTVESTRNIAGDMVHVVRFSDGTKGEYFGDDLRANYTPTERI